MRVELVFFKIMYQGVWFYCYLVSSESRLVVLALILTVHSYVLTLRVPNYQYCIIILRTYHVFMKSFIIQIDFDIHLRFYLCIYVITGTGKYYFYFNFQKILVMYLITGTGKYHFYFNLSSDFSYVSNYYRNR